MGGVCLPVKDFTQSDFLLHNLAGEIRVQVMMGPCIGLPSVQTKTSNQDLRDGLGDVEAEGGHWVLLFLLM